MAIKFIVLGSPQALKRHRMFRRGQHLIAVDPSKDDKADFLTMAHQHAPQVPMDCPLALDVRFYFARPKSHYNKKGLKDTAANWHTARPDIDNLFKFIADSLNGVFWRDDSLICSVVCHKCYDEKPRTEITITEI